MLTTTAVTSAQLEKINRYVPNGFPKLRAEDVLSVNVLVADNLVNRGQSRWSVDSLKKIALLLPGLPALKDHDHYSIDAAWGRFFDAQFKQSDEVGDEILDAAGNSEYNRKIFDGEGYCAVYGQAYVATDHSIVSDIAFGRVSANSLGAFRYRDFLCPDCGFSLQNSKCPHVLDGMAYNDNTPTVPYYIRHDVFDLGESSLVNLPNLPASKVC